MAEIVRFIADHPGRMSFGGFLAVVAINVIAVVESRVNEGGGANIGLGFIWLSLIVFTMFFGVASINTREQTLGAISVTALFLATVIPFALIVLSDNFS